VAYASNLAPSYTSLIPSERHQGNRHAYPLIRLIMQDALGAGVPIMTSTGLITAPGGARLSCPAQRISGAPALEVVPTGLPRSRPPHGARRRGRGASTAAGGVSMRLRVSSQGVAAN